MMKPISHIRISEPCHQDWNKMAASDGGKFCSACNKKVFDLTSKSTEEITKLYMSQEGSLCGRIHSLKNNLSPALFHFRWLSWKKIAVAIFSLFGLKQLSGESATAQTVDAAKMKKEDLQKAGISISTAFGSMIPDTSQFTIRGQIRDRETKEGIPFAPVVIESANMLIGIAQTDDDGRFEFRISFGAFKSNSFAVKLQYLGYDKLEVLNIPLSKTSYFVDLSMQMNATILGEMIIITESTGLIELVNTSDSPNRKTFPKEELEELAK